MEIAAGIRSAAKKADPGMDNIFLEDWIIAAVNGQQSGVQASSSKSSPVKDAHRIAYAWTQIRDCVQRGVLQAHHVEAVGDLLKHSRALHVAEPQAKLLVSLFTSVSAEDPLDVARVRRSAALILSIYVRRTFKSISAYAASRRFLMSTINAVCKSLEESAISHVYMAEAILLLGSICVLSQCEENQKVTCRRAIVEELTRRKEILTTEGLLYAFSGAGYAMVGAHDSILSSILTVLIHIWTPQPWQNGKSHCVTSSSFVKETLMLLHLMEFQGAILQSYEENISLSDANVMLEVLSDGTSHVSLLEVQCASVMASCGFLKSFRSKVHVKKQSASNPKDSWWLDVSGKLHGIVADVGRQTVISFSGNEKVDAGNQQQDALSCGILHELMKVDNILAKPSPKDLLQMQCIALGVSRLGHFYANFFITCCLLYILFQDVLNLAPIYSAQTSDLSSFILSAKANADLFSFTLSAKENSVRSNEYSQLLVASLNILKEKVEGCLFQEVGAIARAVCEQYRIVRAEYQKQIVTSIWNYCRAVYERHRIFVTLCSEELLQKPMVEGLYQPIQLLTEENVSKILEAYFLSIVLFFSTVLDHTGPGKQSVEKNSSTKIINLAVQVLDSVSCVEFYRQVQVPEYFGLIQRSVSWLCSSKRSVAAFILCFPSYQECTKWPKCVELGFASYDWKLDQVQAARVQFYFRVLCSCMEHISDSIFTDILAPTMFLYIQHRTEAVARSSHALFATFLSLEADNASKALNQESLHQTPREQLAVHYMERSLEAYPYVSSFEGISSGVVAIVCHLPPGSPAIIYSIDSLVNKISDRKSRNWGKKPDPDYNDKDVEETVVMSRQSEVQNKIRTLLLHLVLLVDLQVLPHLLKQVAKVVLGLPLIERREALGKAFDIVLGTDDYTRKPVLVPWLQSLSFMCSKL